MSGPIDPSQTVSRLAALLQRSRGGRKVLGGDSSMTGEPGAPEVAATLGDRIRAIAPDHPRRRYAMARVLIEAMLSSEWGDGHLNDAGFQTVIDDVSDAIERSPVLRADLDLVIDALLSDAGHKLEVRAPVPPRSA